MDPYHAFVIEGDASGVATKVTVDGKELSGITLLELVIDPRSRDARTVLRLEFIPGSVRVNTQGKLEVAGREL